CPQIWFQLASADFEGEFPDTRVEWVPLTRDRNVKDLENAIFNITPPILPKNVVATNLRYYASSDVYNQEVRSFLRLVDNLIGFGEDPDNPIIVEVRRPWKRQKLSHELTPIKWSAPTPRVRISVQDDEQLILIPMSCVLGTGIGRRNNMRLILYRRRSLKDQWNEIIRCSIQTYSLLWIYGPPGIGKIVWSVWNTDVRLHTRSYLVGCSLDPLFTSG
ncbi:hypothetical protein L917_12236, partial [Phytophthora nicotianae]